MCLETITERRNNPKATLIAYRWLTYKHRYVVVRRSDPPKLTHTFGHINDLTGDYIARKVMRVGIWHKAVPIPITHYRSNGVRFLYVTGFHAFETRELAEDFGVHHGFSAYRHELRKVKLRDIHTIGMDTSGLRCLVASEMRILPKEKK